MPAQDVEIIIITKPAGSLRPKYPEKVAGFTRKMAGHAKLEGEIARFAGYMANDGDLLTLQGDVDVSMTALTAVFR